MTEKRFTYDFVSVDCPMFYDNKEVIDYDDVVDCLNEQDEIITRLEKENKDLKIVFESRYKSKKILENFE